MMPENEDFEDRLRREVKSAAAGDVPDFDAVWQQAERRVTRYRRGRRLAAVGVIAAIAVAVGMHLGTSDPPAGTYVEIAEFMDTTFWDAPSDSLMPAREYDIYEDLPAVPVSTEAGEGALL